MRCPICDGTGEIETPINNFREQSLIAICDACDGDGELDLDEALDVPNYSDMDCGDTWETEAWDRD